MRAGDGRNAGSTTPELDAACQSNPISTSGHMRPTGDSRNARSVRGMRRLRSERLTPDRNPDLVAHLVESIRRKELFARDGAIEVDLEFLDDLSRSRRHHANAVGEIDRLVDVMGNHQHGLA